MAKANSECHRALEERANSSKPTKQIELGTTEFKNKGIIPNR